MLALKGYDNGIGKIAITVEIQHTAIKTVEGRITSQNGLGKIEQLYFLDKNLLSISFINFRYSNNKPCLL
ncbi:hypothetical protein Glove_136g71 [Diversispora epigaea]|uniref:Uncharacterized protein n=1 Tax=Diversispora epigaea TaxID=1348612 RepID=A0A397IWL6_9GLOM|nr:hypothetical protein Glove_136g71 [Diversispora epigaea]